MLVTAPLTIPILAVATVVGAAIASVLRHADSGTDLTLLPKVIAVGLVAALFGRFALSLCAQLLLEAVARIPQLVRG